MKGLKFQVNRNWQIQFKLFKKLKSFAGFLSELMSHIREDRNNRKFRKTSFQWHINKWIAIFIGLNRSFR